mgnify:CR=1 FL=1
MRTMENENLRVQISDHGAELSSIYDNCLLYTSPSPRDA